MAGYAAPSYLWGRFEVDWKLALARFNVPYFHMRGFTFCHGPYAEPSWKSDWFPLWLDPLVATML
jgi:hypothetical protein